MMDLIIKKKVGNGKNTRFWKDVWHDNHSLSVEFPKLFALEKEQNCYIADRNIDGVWCWKWRHGQRGGEEACQIRNLIDCLQQVEFSNQSDRWW